jgi:hypothetical protein
MSWQWGWVVSKQFCLYGFLILFIASLSMQFFRAKLRKKIIRQSEHLSHGTAFEYEWEGAGRGLGMIFEDFNKMKLLKKYSRHLPNEILREIRKFRILSSVELATTISMLLTAAFAYTICN